MINDENSMNQIVSCASRMIELLTSANQINWVNVLEAILKKDAENLNALLTDLLSLYGGMGSINDLVLYTDGRISNSLNDEFDALRTVLYELCER